MAKKTNNTEQTDKPIKYPEPNISLSQAMLAPLLSIFKAQIHAGRAFLNFLLQIGTPHLELDENGNIKEDAREKQGRVYTQDFRFETSINGKKQIFEIKVPTLSLVPVAPLGIESGEFEFDFQVEDYHYHRQIQPSEKESLKNDAFKAEQRPWYLISEPINFSGNVAPPSSENTDIQKSGSTMKIKIKVSKQPIPAGLDKLLTSFTQNIVVNEIPGEPTNEVTPNT